MSDFPNASQNHQNDHVQARSMNKIRDMIQSASNERDLLKQHADQLKSKLHKKETEIDDSKLQLSSLEDTINLHPIHGKEYTDVEQEMIKVYEGFVSSFMNLDYLKMKLKEHKIAEEGKLNRIKQEQQRNSAKYREREQEYLKESPEFEKPINSAKKVSSKSKEEARIQQEDSDNDF